MAIVSHYERFRSGTLAECTFFMRRFFTQQRYPRPMLSLGSDYSFGLRERHSYHPCTQASPGSAWLGVYLAPFRIVLLLGRFSIGQMCFRFRVTSKFVWEASVFSYALVFLRLWVRQQLHRENFTYVDGGFCCSYLQITTSTRTAGCSRFGFNALNMYRLLFTRVF